jgi:DNA repair protein RecN (Recombination protein N)
VLRELHISGLGVIDDLDLEFHPGLNVLTGETGAGKTMVTVGLALALGQRGSASLVRPGANAARVQARFDAPIPEGALEWVDEGELVTGRTVGADQKSSVRIGGQIATVGVLASLAPELVEVHGQYSGQRLLQPLAQAMFLDRFCGADHLRTVSVYRECHRRLAELRERIAELVERARDRERESDLLAYQVREIQEANPEPGQVAVLEAEEARLGNAERLVELVAAAGAKLADDGGGLDGLRSAAAGLAEAASVDQGMKELAGRAAALAEEAAELTRDVREYGEGLQPNPARLEEIRERTRLLKSLQRKYGEDEAAVLQFGERASERLRQLAGAEDEQRDLEEDAARARGELGELAGRIGSARSAAAPELSELLQRELEELGMQDASIVVALEPLAEPGPTGCERVELRFAGGRGQAALPLARTASGGELSRVMLSCRSVLADLDAVPTLVFDEVDAGIGGRAGVAVGRRLARIARARQVLVVTHLPQIASFADRHIRVEKQEGNAAVSILSDEDRVSELSRMLSGLPGSESAAVHAEELLAEAGRAKSGAG